MIVLILQSAPTGLRGELSRWMIEPRAGVFIGTVSALVREKLWEKTVKASPEGGGIMIYRSPTEQGFAVRTFGETSRSLRDYEGLTLVKIPEIKREVEIEV
jgi:CRISPR-associated protein Cas2